MISSCRSDWLMVQERGDRGSHYQPEVPGARATCSWAPSVWRWFSPPQNSSGGVPQILLSGCSRQELIRGSGGGLPPPPLLETRSLTVAPAAQNVEAGKLPNPKSVKRCCWSPYSSAGHVRLLSKRRPGAETLGGLEETRGPSGEFSRLHTLANGPRSRAAKPRKARRV